MKPEIQFYSRIASEMDTFQNMMKSRTHCCAQKHQLALATLLCVIWTIFSGCAKTSIDGAPLPKVFGVYAVSDGKMIQMTGDVLSVDISPPVAFLVFAKEVTFGAGKFPLVQVPLKPALAPQSGSDTWGSFLRTVDERASKAQEALGGVPAGSVDVPCSSGPVDGHADMLYIKPTAPLQPGQYFFAGTRFWISKTDFLQKLRAATNTDLANGNWQSALTNARIALQIAPDDSEMKNVPGKIYDGLMDSANKAHQLSQWKTAEDFAKAAAWIQSDRPSAKIFLTNLPFDRAISDGGTALKEEKWETAVSLFKEAQTFRPRDESVGPLLRTAILGYWKAQYLIGEAKHDFDLVVSAAKGYLSVNNTDDAFWVILRQGFYDQSMTSARLSLESGKLDDALDGTNRAIELKHDDPAATKLQQQVIERIRSDHNYYGRQFVRLETSPAGTADIESVQISPDNKSFLIFSDRELFIASRDGSRKTQNVLNVSECIVSPDQKLVFLAHAGGYRPHMLNSTGPLWQKTWSYPDQIQQSLYTPDSQTLVCAITNRICVFRAQTGEQVATYTASTGANIMKMIMSPNGKYVICSHGNSGDHVLSVFDLEQKAFVKSLPLESGYIGRFKFSNDSQLLFVEQLHGTSVFRTSDFKLKSVFDPQGLLSISPDSTKVAFSTSGKIEIWSIVDGRKKLSIRGGDYIAFRPDWGAVAVSSGRETGIYSTENGQLLGEIDGAAYFVTFLADNRLIVEQSRSHNNSLEVYGLNPVFENRWAKIQSIVCPAGNMTGLGHGGQCLLFLSNGVPVDIKPFGEKTTKSFSAIADRIHPGIEIEAQAGSPVLAVLDGEVTDEIIDTNDPDFSVLGYSVVVHHPRSPERPESYSLYSNLAERPNLPIGEQVTARNTIVGKAAGISKPVHFEIRRFPSRFFDQSKSLTLEDTSQSNTSGILRLKEAWLTPDDIL